MGGSINGGGASFGLANMQRKTSLQRRTIAVYHTKQAVMYYLHRLMKNNTVLYRWLTDQPGVSIILREWKRTGA